MYNHFLSVENKVKIQIISKPHEAKTLLAYLARQVLYNSMQKTID
jgi:hypothetical protein